MDFAFDPAFAEDTDERWLSARRLAWRAPTWRHRQMAAHRGLLSPLVMADGLRRAVPYHMR